MGNLFDKTEEETKNIQNCIDYLTEIGTNYSFDADYMMSDADSIKMANENNVDLKGNGYLLIYALYRTFYKIRDPWMVVDEIHENHPYLRYSLKEHAKSLNKFNMMNEQINVTNYVLVTFGCLKKTVRTYLVTTRMFMYKHKHIRIRLLPLQPQPQPQPQP